MPATGERMRKCGCALLAGALCLALFAGGCSGLGAPSAATPDARQGSSSLSNFFSGSSSAKGTQTVAGAQPDVNCPGVDIRRGASTLTIAPPGEKTAMTLKYQGSFVRAARECSVVDGNMVMKIGVEGRVVVGPAGGPGKVDVPLRFAVVQETPSGIRPIATKFLVIPVVVDATGNTPFVHVEDMMFPIPTPTAQLDEYVVYVGFDPVSAEAQAKPPKVRPKSKSKPAAGAN
ncbi:MAG: hypothetical protein ACLP19_01455 [Xanthobacteraceae bacterium]